MNTNIIRRERSENYQKIQFLGAGAFGETWKAKVLKKELREKFGDIVAIKIPLSKEKEKTLIQELINTAHLHLSLRDMKSEYIVRYLGFDLLEDSYVMVMEFCQGNLRSAIGEIGHQQPLGIEETIDITEQVCKGLQAAHESGLFHRDIKPENIMLSIYGDTIRVKIGDFGISKMLSSSDLASSARGTLYYMAPEVLNGKGSFYSDIFSLGVMMYEMATGSLPFNGTSIEELIDNIKHQQPVPPEELNPDIDAPLSAIILKAIEREPEKRYRTAAELLKDVRAYRDMHDAKKHHLDQRLAEIQDLLFQNRIKEAETGLLALCKEYPSNMAACLHLGEFYNRCKQYRKAVRIFENGIAANPDYALFHRDIALSYYNLGRTEEALAALARAVELGLEGNLETHARYLLGKWKKERET